MIKVLACIAIFLAFGFKSASAFEETFSGYSDNWIYTENNGSIEFVDDSMLLKSDSAGFPYVLSNIDEPLNSENYEINIRFKYLVSGASGDGISVGYSGSPYNFTVFGIWLDNHMGFHFYYNDFSSPESQGFCKDFSNTSELHERTVTKKITLKNPFEWHDLYIVYKDKTYEFFLDSKNEEDLLYRGDAKTDCVPKKIWFGHYLVEGYGDWSDLQIKHIKIDNFEMEKKRYVVVPGLGASWNPRAMVGVAGGEWTMTPFVTHYNNLINLLAQKTGENPLVWNYDWREPIDNIVPKFNDFVNNQVEEDEKVEVIGHSLGGLVGRIWQEEFDDNPRVDRVITLGSPHKGATKAYETWMGAYVSGKLDMGAVATKVLIMLNRFKAKTEVGVVRNLAPVLKDLLPVYNFASKNGSELGWQTMMFPNSYIGELNNQYAGNDNLINIVANAGSNTLYKLELGPASKLDKMLGYWAEGKPKTRITSDGDGTVLVLSAGLDNTKKIAIFSSHGNMPDNSRAEILGELGLENESFSMNNQVNDNIYFYLGSPATMTVDCDKSNPITDTAGWVVIPKGGNQSCLVELRGTGDGEYHLVAGLDRGWEDWDAWEGLINNGEVKKWKVELNKMILVPQEARDWWGRLEYLVKSLLERYPGNQNLKLALKAVENKRLGQLKAQTLVFSRKNKELTVTSEIIKAIYFLGRQDKSNSKAVESVFEDIWNRQYQENRLAGWWRLGEELL